MSAENDLALAYLMGYDDALAKRKPESSKAQTLAPFDLAVENAKLWDDRERLFKANVEKNGEVLRLVSENAKLRELVRGLVYATHPADRARLIADAAELGAEVSDA